MGSESDMLLRICILILGCVSHNEVAPNRGEDQDTGPALSLSFEFKLFRKRQFLLQPCDSTTGFFTTMAMHIIAQQ